jgi:UDP-N-acetylmuramoyl-L-alanyl-D-glutamate--2,6-diaminopimelate ligase
MPGAHNVLNACAALGAGLAAGASLDQAVSALAAMRGTRGRLEPVHNSRKLHVFVDYAHTDDALRTVLFNLGEIRRSAGLQNRIITVFGCGGDRDRGKRPLMLRAALDGSDHVIVTSDNPRTEDPHAIINEIIGDEMRGARASDISSEVDRKRAIGQAIATARPGDVVLIAGKGHETTQTVGAEKRPFDDVQVAQEFLEVEP